MTAAQEQYAKGMRQRIMAICSKRGWDYEESHRNFEAWVGVASLRAMTIDQLKEILGVLGSSGAAAGGRYERPSRPLDEMTTKEERAGGMATEKQIRYASLIARRYAELKGIPPEKAFKGYHKWLKHHSGEDTVAFCDKYQASKIISMMEIQFIKEFGKDEYRKLTGKTWQYRGKKYTKYTEAAKHTRKYRYKDNYSGAGVPSEPPLNEE